MLVSGGVHLAAEAHRQDRAKAEDRVHLQRVLIEDRDLVALAGVVLVISILASLLGIWKAMRVEPNEALMG